jgi:hypothetical protein
MLELAIIAIIGFALLFPSTLLLNRPVERKERSNSTDYRPVLQQSKGWPFVG